MRDKSKKDNPFKEAEDEREKIVNEQEEEINKLYRDAARDLGKSIKRLEDSSTSYARDRRQYLNSLKNEINVLLRNIDKNSEKIIHGNIDRMVTKVIEVNSIYMHNVGFNNANINPSIRIRMAQRIIDGDLYRGNFTLSKAIWGDNYQKTKEINNIISKGILKGQDPYYIAKNLEAYVNPNQRKIWNWSSVYPGSRRKIDYNAQRLARTMVSHAYQETFVAMTIKNPWITAYQWITSGGDKVCDLCLDRESQNNFGLGPGIYPKDKLPLDHPNGMCTFDIVCPYTDNEIAEDIADWYLKEGDDNMNRMIDEYLKSLS